MERDFLIRVHVDGKAYKLQFFEDIVFSGVSIVESLLTLLVDCTHFENRQ
jgi:hypothetical protein